MHRGTHSGETSLLRIRQFSKIAFHPFLENTRVSLRSILVLLSLVTVPAPVWGQDQDGTVEPPLTERTVEPPFIVRIAPAAAAPQTRIQVEGYRLRANPELGGRVLFVQGANEYEVASSGGSYEIANMKQGLQDLSVVVPDALQPGPCKLMVKVDGRRSRPFDFQINVPATAVVLTEIRPLTPQPTETIWIEGSGFAASDEVELVDAMGRKHSFATGFGSSNANTIALTLPKNLPAGEAHLRVIEHRSSTDQQSNVLSFMIVRGPTPLAIYADWLKPVAPGQWLDLVVGSHDPLKGAERVEVSFRQNEQFLIVAVKGVSDLRIQVLASLTAGVVMLETRTIVNGEASQWSAPIKYRLLEKPAAAKVYSLEIRAVRTEVAFRQGGRIVAIVAVRAADYPRVRVPTDKLSPGSVEVLTRVWRGGRPTEWSFQHHGFDWPNKSLPPDGTMDEGPFIARVPFGPETPKALAVFPGEKLVLEGTFPVESPEDIRVTLQGEEGLPVVLNARGGDSPRRAKIELPDTLGEGEWEVTLHSVNDGISMKLPIRLKVLKRKGKRE